MLFILLACAPESQVANATDLRIYPGEDYPEPAATDIVWDVGEQTVQPYTDEMMCYFGTYTGEDVGLIGFNSYQDLTYGHHVVLMGTTESAVDKPDGTVVDCTSTEQLAMENLEPIILPTGGNGEDLGMELPDGIATKLRSGQRWVLQTHHVNTTDTPILVNAIGVAPTMPVDDVVEWAAPVVMNRQEFEIPPHESASVTFDCTFEPEYNLLYMVGHMHEWGDYIKLEHIVDGQPIETLYETDWDPVYRDAPPLVDYGSTGRNFPANSTFRTTCEWYNDTDEPLTFPAEMCDHVAMAYPALTSDICSD